MKFNKEKCRQNNATCRYRQGAGQVLGALVEKLHVAFQRILAAIKTNHTPGLQEPEGNARVEVRRYSPLLLTSDLAS